MANLLTTIPAFLFALGVIIFVHEAGHLLAAKAFGMRVLTFSLGFGKRLWGFERGGTDYRISLLPLGGYVRLPGENPDEVSDDPGDFLNRPRWQRIVVYLAGPFMNFVLALLLTAGVFMVGVEVSNLRDVPPVVGAVEPDSPGAAAGILPGDVVTAVDGVEVVRWQQVAEVLLTSPERAVALVLTRPGEPATRSVTVTPTKEPRYGIGLAGIYPRVLPRVAEVFVKSPAEAAGLRSGDELRAVDGRPLEDAQAFIAYVEARAGQELALEVVRDAQRLTLQVTPADQGGKGKIGIRLGAFQRYGPARAFVESWHYNLDLVRQTLMVIGKIARRDIGAEGAFSGPIQIAEWTGAAARSGFRNLIYLMGMLSVSIGLLNLFPIPLLDGGQITLLLIESIRRRDLPPAWKLWINNVGFILLIALMVLVTFFDIKKTFS